MSFSIGSSTENGLMKGNKVMNKHLKLILIWLYVVLWCLGCAFYAKHVDNPAFYLLLILTGVCGYCLGKNMIKLIWEKYNDS